MIYKHNYTLPKLNLIYKLARYNKRTNQVYHVNYIFLGINKKNRAVVMNVETQNVFDMTPCWASKTFSHPIEITPTIDYIEPPKMDVKKIQKAQSKTNTNNSITVEEDSNKWFKEFIELHEKYFDKVKANPILLVRAQSVSSEPLDEIITGLKRVYLCPDKDFNPALANKYMDNVFKIENELSKSFNFDDFKKII